MNPLNSVLGAITTGIVLVILLALILTGQSVAISQLHLDRWLHIVSGITWIGLLYYFNVVQVPGLAAAAADKGGPGGAGVSKYIAPRALLWFRWAAVATWLTGAYYLMIGYGSAAYGLHAPAGFPHYRHRRLAGHHHAVQRLGIYLAEPEKSSGSGSSI